MTRNLCWWAALAAVCVLGCDDSRRRVPAGEEGRPDRGIAVDAGEDAAAFDVGVLDAGEEPADLGGPLADQGADAEIVADVDAKVDAALDAALDAELDAELDAALDAEVDFAVEPPDGGILGRFVVGRAQAADGRSPVTVRAGDVVAAADRDGFFRIGPIDAETVELVFEAPDHQSEALSLDLPAEDGETALPVEVLLYRGIRVAAAANGRLVFRSDDAWFLWSNDDALFATETAAIAPRTLVAEAFEVFLGFEDGGEAVHIRRRTRPGVAGDIDRVSLAGEATPLFVEAQPWVRAVAGRLLAMVETREALSRLVSAPPRGGAEVEIDAGVPWLLVTTLADERVAWAAGAPPGFGVWVGDAAGRDAAQVSPPNGATTDEFLLTTPDRAGLVWRAPDGALWRWSGVGAAARVATDTLADPRPRLLRDGRVLFARADGAGASFHVAGAGPEIELVRGVRRSAGTLVSEVLYIERLDGSLWAGELSGAGWGEALPAPVGAVMSSGGGVIALVGGVAWRHRPDRGAERLGGLGLSQLSFAPLGATAWQADAGAVWFLPAPGGEGEAGPLVEGAPRLGRLNAPGGQSMYLLGPEGWFRAHLPLGAGADPVFDREFASLSPIDGERLLGLDPEGGLWMVEAATGLTTGWARAVSRFERSGRGGWVAYVCDRGTFLVPMTDD